MTELRHRVIHQVDPVSHVVSPTGTVPLFDWSRLIALYFILFTSIKLFNEADRIALIGLGQWIPGHRTLLSKEDLLSHRVGEIPEGPDPWGGSLLDISDIRLTRRHGER